MTPRRLIAPVIYTLLWTGVSLQPASGQVTRRGPAPEPIPADPSQFTVARLQYPGGGDWYWGPSALPNLLNFIKENTGIPINDQEVRTKPSDQDLFYHPFIYCTGHGNMRFSDGELEQMRRYLIGGGFWFINDSYGMDAAVRRELKRIFPDREMVELPFSHSIYHEPFEFPDGPPKIHKHDGKSPRGYAILDHDRVVVFYLVESDIGDGWEDPQVHKDPPEKRLEALRLGTNLAVYSLTH
ncbi:MAG: DUF4159 domain-containing protein [candidate division Zixibacteria bacterium]|nr:DUF4159 domain-containing protein [candidate division Zixibacteria bacterium]